ncbi:uncharacterized protein TNCV_4676151 [Trichonephila clavipes]|nr:uncharacterized protein TNCV_4676151 [Trichonephila clavipes]
MYSRSAPCLVFACLPCWTLWWVKARRDEVVFVPMDPSTQCPGKGLFLPNLNINDIAKNSLFLILSQLNKEMSRKSPFITHKDLIGIGGEPKSIKNYHQTVCHGQLTCSGCASVGHVSLDCSLEQKCVNFSQPHSSDSKLCPKWKLEKEIQEIKTNKNISYLQARKIIVPQSSQTYAQAAKSSTVTTTTQTDENITKIVCPPLKLLQSLISIPKPTMSSKITALTKSSTKTQAHFFPPTSSVTVTSSSESQPPIPLMDTAPAIVYLPLLHLPHPINHFLHPQYQCLHLYQHVLLLKLLPLLPLLYLLHPRLQN